MQAETGLINEEKVYVHPRKVRQANKSSVVKASKTISNDSLDVDSTAVTLGYTRLVTRHVKEEINGVGAESRVDAVGGRDCCCVVGRGLMIKAP